MHWHAQGMYPAPIRMVTGKVQHTCYNRRRAVMVQEASFRVIEV